MNPDLLECVRKAMGCALDYLEFFEPSATYGTDAHRKALRADIEELRALLSALSKIAEADHEVHP